MKKEISMPYRTETNKLLTEYSSGVRKLKKSVHQLTKAVMDFRPFAEAWTIHEHAIHLADMEANGYVRFRCILGESGKTVMTVDEDKWTANIGYDQQPVGDYVSLFSLLRKVTSQYLSRNLDNKEMWEERYIVHPERGNIALKEWVKLYSAHADIHVKYIERNKGIWKKAHSK
jgi:hypothetical protein